MQQTMLAQTLQKLIDDGQTSAQELAQVSGYATNTIYKWLAGGSDIRIDALCSWLWHHPNPRVHQTLMSVISRGRATIRQEFTDAQLDHDGDGDVDLDDAVDKAIEAQSQSIKYLTLLRNAHRKGRVTRDHLMDLNESRVSVRYSWDVVDAIAQREAAKHANRRKCGGGHTHNTNGDSSTPARLAPPLPARSGF